MEDVKGHAISVLFLPARRMSMSSGNTRQPPQPRSSSTRLTRDVAQERQREALGHSSRVNAAGRTSGVGVPEAAPALVFSTRTVSDGSWEATVGSKPSFGESAMQKMVELSTAGVTLTQSSG